MPFFAIVVAALAAGAILLIVIGLAGSSPVDPVQARLTQLGTMQAKNLEELELQQPFLERTLRPLASNLSGYVVGFLPIALAGFLFIAAPGFMKPMFDNPPEILGLPAGVVILMFGGLMMFIGFMIIRRIVDIEV